MGLGFFIWSFVGSEGLIAQMTECELDTDCIAQPDNAFMLQYGECLTGELTEEEKVWSDKMVRAWTNFAIYG